LYSGLNGPRRAHTISPGWGIKGGEFTAFLSQTHVRLYIQHPLHTGYLMIILNKIGDFLLSEWLWSMTFAWSYFVILFFILWFLLYCIKKTSLFYACLLSFLAITCSFIIFLIIVIGIFFHLLQWWYVPQEYNVTITPFFANFYLATLYACLQSIFFYSTHRLFRLTTDKLFLIIYLSNGLAAYISYLYIITAFKHCV